MSTGAANILQLVCGVLADMKIYKCYRFQQPFEVTAVCTIFHAKVSANHNISSSI